MADKTVEFLTAVVSRLKSVTAVTDQVGSRVYTRIPQNPTYPHVLLSASSDPVNMHTSLAQRFTLRAQVFDRSQSVKKTLQARSAIIDALVRMESSLNVTGGTVVMLETAPLSDYFLEDDGKTWQGIVEFSAYVE